MKKLPNELVSGLGCVCVSFVSVCERLETECGTLSARSTSLRCAKSSPCPPVRRKCVCVCGGARSQSIGIRKIQKRRCAAALLPRSAYMAIWIRLEVRARAAERERRSSAVSLKSFQLLLQHSHVGAAYLCVCVCVRVYLCISVSLRASFGFLAAFCGWAESAAGTISWSTFCVCCH